MSIRTSRVAWAPCWRIIPSRFPPVQLFERVTDPADLEAVIEVESLTNDRLRDEVGSLRLVPPEDRVTGPGSSFIMAAFTHINRDGSRFADGTYGAFYAGIDLDTAIAETRHHRERFMRATDEPPMELDMRVLNADLDGRLHDIRGMKDELPQVYDRDAYAAGQGLARELRAEARSPGIVYDSVRHDPGECVAVFRPPLLSNCHQERHLCYVWDGSSITHVYRKEMHHGQE